MTRFHLIHYPIFVAQRANITATRLARLLEAQFCPARKARPRLGLQTTALRPHSGRSSTFSEFVRSDARLMTIGVCKDEGFSMRAATQRWRLGLCRPALKNLHQCCRRLICSRMAAISPYHPKADGLFLSGPIETLGSSGQASAPTTGSRHNAARSGCLLSHALKGFKPTTLSKFPQ